MPNIQPFELYSDAYENWFVENEIIYKLELEAIKQLIPSGKFGMEVGIGSGKFAVPFGIKIGVEPSAKMAEIARARGIDVIEAVAEKLPFDDNIFDFVLFVTTICFVDDIKKSFLEARRVLKNNGSIIIGFVDKESELGKKYLVKKNKSKFYNIATFYSADEVLNYLSECGFSNFKIKQTIFPKNEKKTVKDGYGTGSFVVIKAS